MGFRPAQQPPQQPELRLLQEPWDLWLPPQQQPPRCRRRLLGKQQQLVELEPQQPVSPQQPPPQQPPSPTPEPQQPPQQEEEREGTGAGHGVGPWEDPLAKPLAEDAPCWDMAELVTANLEETRPFRGKYTFATRGNVSLGIWPRVSKSTWRGVKEKNKAPRKVGSKETNPKQVFPAS